MKFAPWPTDEEGKYRAPDEGEIRRTYGLSGEAVAETLRYFESLGGDTARLVSLLNDHVLDRSYRVTRETLLDGSSWYSNEYYFYFIMFTKKVIGRYDFHYGEGSNEPLSRFHHAYEQGFLSCVPYGDGNEDVSNTIAYNMYQYFLGKFAHFTDLLAWTDLLCAERGVAPYSADIHPVKDAWINSGLMCFIYDFIRILSNSNDFEDGVDGCIGNVRYFYLSLVSLAFLPGATQKILNIVTSVYDLTVVKRRNKLFFEVEWKAPYKKEKFGIYALSSYENSTAVTLRSFLLFLKEALRLPEIPPHNILTPIWATRVEMWAEIPSSIVGKRIIYGTLSLFPFTVLAILLRSSAHSIEILSSVAAVASLVMSQLVISLMDERRQNKTLLAHREINLREQERNFAELRALADDLVEEKKHLTEKVRERTLEIEAANRKLREYDQSKTDFFYNVSHELRTPLTLIKAPLEALVDGKYGNLNPRQESSAQMALRNADRLHEQVNALLDFASVDQKRIMPELIPIHLGELCALYAAELASRADSCGIALEMPVPLDGPATVMLDLRLFERAFFNIALNALKFTPRGGSVRISVDAGPETVTVRVSDTGIGIPKDKLGRIFERYVQVDRSSSRRYEGTGLGLALVKEICAILGATVSVESELGVGSTFSLAFARSNDDAIPLKDGMVSSRVWQSARRENPEAPFSPSLAAPGDARATVLLVEDTADMRAFLRDCIADRYRVIEAANGEDALAVFRSRRDIDLIVTDIMMPVMDGRALYRAVAGGESPCRVPVLFVTARASSEEKIDALSEGAIDYIYKPFSVDELLAKIDALLSLVRHGRETVESEIEARVVAAIRGKWKEPVSPVSIGSFCLSPRETEVAKMLASGMRNKEIASGLGLSERTVAHHVESIFRKSGAGNRLEFISLCSKTE